MKPSVKLQLAAKGVLVAAATVAAIRPIVEQNQKNALKKLKLYSVAKPHRPTELVLSDEQTHRLTEADFKSYHRAVARLNEKNGITVDNPDFCPLLVAENDLYKAKVRLLDASSGVLAITGMTKPMLYNDPERFDKFVGLTLEFALGEKIKKIKKTLDKKYKISDNNNRDRERRSK